jgi:tetratricopeptide (TPR) repeat protein
MRTPFDTSKANALVVGIGARKQDSHLMKMTSTDAEMVAGELASKCRMSKKNIELLLEKDAVTSGVLHSLEKIAEDTLKTPADIFIFYFSGHGYVLKGNYYLICSDTVNSDIESGGIRADVLVSKLQSINTQKMIVALDCCHAEGMTATDNNPVKKDIIVLDKPNRIVLSASRYEQVSFLSKPVSVFTYAFLEGLAGKYLEENEKDVNVFDLAMYIRERVSPLSRGRQKPQLNVLQNNLTSNFIIAHYPKGKPEHPVFDESFALLDADGKEIDTGVPGEIDDEFRTKYSWTTVNMKLAGDSNMVITVEGNVNSVSVNLLNVSELTEKMDQIIELKKDLMFEDDPERRLQKSERINKLQKEVDQQRENISALAKTLSKIEINTDRLNSAYIEFLKGNIKEADLILKKEDLFSEQSKLLEESTKLSEAVSELEEMRIHNSNEFLMKARLTLLRYDLPDRFSVAEEYFRNSIKSYKNTKNLFDYGAYLRVQNNFTEAIEIFSECITIYENAGGDRDLYKPDIASAYTNLGFCYEKTGKPNDALRCYLHSENLYKELESKKPGSYAIDLAETLNVMGSLYQSQNDFETAGVFYARSLEIIQSLTNTGTEDDQYSLIIAHNNLGTFHMERAENERAIVFMKKALSLIECVENQNNEKYNTMLSLILSNLGKIFTDMREFTEAKEYLFKALEIREKLCVLNPSAHNPSLAITLNYLSILFQKVPDYKKASDYLIRALKIRESLYKFSPEVFAAEYAETLNNLGILFGKAGEEKSASQYLSKAIEIFERLSIENPARFGLKLCQSNLALGIAEVNSGNEAKGIDAVKRALDIAAGYPGIPAAMKVAENASAILAQLGAK